MSFRESFLSYVKSGSKKPFVSLQLGAGAGFDAKLAGKEWNSEATIEDTIRAYELVGCAGLYNIGLPYLSASVPELKRRTKTDFTATKRVTEQWLETPFGTLHWKFHELPRSGVTPLRYPVTIDDDIEVFDIVQWYADQMLKGLNDVADLLEAQVKKILPYGPVSIQWNLQPFELLGLASVDNLILLAKIAPDRYRKCCDHIRDINMELLACVFEAGADFVFLGSPGAEMMSPEYYEMYIVPDSQTISRKVHELGGLTYCHICSPIEPFLSQGYYNQMGLDLFETLSPPPVGNVSDLARAREITDDCICTRGNIGLDLLMSGSVEDVEKATLDVIEAIKGHKHMIAASDYLFYSIPLENAQTVVRTVQQYA